MWRSLVLVVLAALRAINLPTALATVVATAFFAVGVGAAVAVNSSRQLRVGLVLFAPLVGRTSNPVQYDTYRGVVRAKRDFHLGLKVVTPQPPGTEGQYVAALSYLALQRYDLVIAPGSASEAVAQPARRFPYVKFVLFDGTLHGVRHPPANVAGTVFHTEQAAYLAGYLAARMADRGPRPHVISSVGGIPVPTVTSYITGFQAGAKRADPQIKVLNAYTNDFANEAKCRHAALAQIAAGSRVVFNVAGICGLGALHAAKQKGVYGIGVDTDQSYLGRFILTSVVKNQGVAAYDLIKRVVDGRLRTGGNLSYDLRNHGVGLGRFSPKVPPALRRTLVRLAAQIKLGKIVVPATLGTPR